MLSIHGDVESECLITGPLPYRRAANHWNGEPPPIHPSRLVGSWTKQHYTGQCPALSYRGFTSTKVLVRNGN